jgi:hypothetical protein
MPRPVSLTVMVQWSAWARQETVISPPFGVNLTALPIRFRTICSVFSRSASAATSSSPSARVKRTPLALNWGRIIVHISTSSGLRGTGSMS